MDINEKIRAREKQQNENNGEKDYSLPERNFVESRSGTKIQ
ncbi:MAG: hypothetical protein ACLU80_11260 [Dorea sp.]